MVICDRLSLARLWVVVPFLCALTGNAKADGFDYDIEAARELSPPAGFVITPSNLESARQLLDPDLAGLIEKGWLTLTVGEPISFRPHKNYIDATRNNTSPAVLGSEPGIILNYVGGRPFPEDPQVSDPQAGEKLVWNMRYAYGGDGGKIPEMYWQYRDMKSQKVERELEFSAALMRLMYRHVVEPIPSVKDNRYKTYSALTLTAHEPGDVAKTNLLIFYNSDDTAEEQGWMYVPLLRRVRRVATTMRTDSFLGSDIMIEDFLGYTGRIKDMNWSYGGTEHILLPMYRHDKIPHADRKARREDYNFVDFHGHSGCFPNINWQVRKVHVLEGTPKRSDHPVGKRLLYLDAQTMMPIFGKLYDRADVLWKYILGGVAHPDSHLPLNKGSGVPLIDTASVVDIQSMHCTTIQMVTKANLPKMKRRNFEPSALNHMAR
jgi:hypothetical protein